MTATEAEWEDWYLPPVVGSKYAQGEYEITGENQIVQIIDAGNLNAATLKLQFVGLPGETCIVSFVYGYYLGGEATYLMTTTYLTLQHGIQHVMPITATAPKFYLVVNKATSDSGTLEYAYITRSGSIETLSMAGSSPTSQGDETVNGSTIAYLFPEVCTPGQVALYVETDSPSWDLYLRTYWAGVYRDVLVANDANPLTMGATFTVPAGSWTFYFSNKDSSSCELGHTMIYQQ